MAMKTLVVMFTTASFHHFCSSPAVAAMVSFVIYCYCEEFRDIAVSGTKNLKVGLTRKVSDKSPVLISHE